MRSRVRWPISRLHLARVLLNTINGCPQAACEATGATAAVLRHART